MMPREENILERAYDIWETSGKPDGKEREFWRRAEQELEEEEARPTFDDFVV
jgi:Protein of unknown function (DUF2934)